MISDIFGWIMLIALGIFGLGMTVMVNIIAYDLITKGDVPGSIFMGLLSIILDSAIIAGLTSD